MKKIIKISILALAVFIIISTIVLIGYSPFNWNKNNGLAISGLEASNNSSWIFVPSPDAALNGTYGHKLNSVISFSPNDSWTVGFSPVPNGPLFAKQILIQRWNGKNWSNIVPLQVIGYDNVELKGISGSSNNDIWVIGRAGKICCAGGQAIIEHWNGTNWSFLNAPNITGVGKDYYLNDIAVVNSSDVWAVGYYIVYNPYNQPARTLILRWNGKNWSQAASPNLKTSAGTNTTNILSSVSVVNSSNVWAAGYYGGSSAIRPLTLHWDSKSWKNVNISVFPSGAYTQPIINDIKAISSTDVVAVGYQQSCIYGDCGGYSLPSVLRWNGKNWSQITLPKLVNARSFNSVSATNSSDVWAVGLGAPGLIIHWNGTSWVQFQSASANGSNITALYGVFAGTNRNVWAVGNYQRLNSTFFSPYIERYSN